MAGSRQAPQRFVDTRMLDGTGEQSAWSWAGQTEDRQVVGLGGAGLVKMTSSGCALRRWAVRSRASSRAWRAWRPARWPLAGLPGRSKKYGRIASHTAGNSGVLALLSR